MTRDNPNEYDGDSQMADGIRARRGLAIIAACALFWIAVAWVALKLL